jgi:Transmembrane secretion effector
MADPVTGEPEEERAPPTTAPALRLLRRRNFRLVFSAVAASELGDSLHYIALMWVALQEGGPLGVVAVRLADSIPSLIFGLHGGLAADRFDRRSLMVAADTARAVTLVPIAVAGLSGHLPIWGLVVAAFLLETATSYFEPAYGALVPALVERENVQQANALVQAAAQAISVGGWALAAGLLTFMPISAFFAVNAASFVVSALLTARIPRSGPPAHGETPHIREGLAALRARPVLATGVAVLGIAVTISAGTWIGGLPTLIRDHLHGGAGAFSIVMVGYAAGSIVSGVVLARLRVPSKALASIVVWVLYLPAYGLIAFAGTTGVVVAGAFAAALGQSSARVLLVSAIQEDVPDALLGRVLGLESLVHRGAHATGLLFVAPIFAVAAPEHVFAAAALALTAVGIGGTLLALALRVEKPKLQDA